VCKCNITILLYYYTTCYYTNQHSWIGCVRHYYTPLTSILIYNYTIMILYYYTTILLYDYFTTILLYFHVCSAASGCIG
jgi:hypothetical protein